VGRGRRGSGDASWAALGWAEESGQLEQLRTRRYLGRCLGQGITHFVDTDSSENRGGLVWCLLVSLGMLASAAEDFEGKSKSRERSRVLYLRLPPKQPIRQPTTPWARPTISSSLL